MEAVMKKNKKISSTVVTNTNQPTKLHATVKEAVQKRITPSDHSSIIPGIDVNELKHSLDLLKYALDYSEAIVDTVQVPLIVLNKKLQVLTANRSFYDTFKLTPKETENKSIYQLNNKAWNIHKLKVMLEKILPANTHLDNYEVEIDFPDIGERTMVLNARRTYRQVNNTEAILLAIEDVTSRKQLEKQKDDFIGIVSHELKTPLTSIKIFSHLLEKHQKQNNDKKGAFYLKKMTDQMERLTQLMASFVNVYKIQTGILELKKKHFKLDELISATVSDFQYTTTSHVIVHECRSNATVYADRERITQVLINLISNAIKYSPHAKKIIITCVQNDRTVTVSVQDFGYGIPKSEQKKVFDRFFRVKSKREKDISGLGLGLYISQEIIERHKGKIWVESMQEKGSTFSFMLPIDTKKKS
jgi:PAS domain S-box-containing protein